MNYHKLNHLILSIRLSTRKKNFARVTSFAFSTLDNKTKTWWKRNAGFKIFTLSRLIDHRLGVAK